jgi:hypothetical protein
MISWREGWFDFILHNLHFLSLNFLSDPHASFFHYLPLVWREDIKVFPLF